MKTASDILLEAASLLEEEGKWGKSAYFNFNDKGCAMCAHGAIAYCGNPKVKETVDNGVGAASLVRLARRAEAEVVVVENLTPEQYVSKHYGELGLAHYRAAKVGLTFNYNDHPDTTKQDVINKLREAALLPPVST